MLITRTSRHSGIVRTLDLPITQEQITAHAAGALAQHAFPNLTPGQREFYMSGITDEEWAEMFPPETTDDPE
jgi:hypothetical protein